MHTVSEEQLYSQLRDTLQLEDRLTPEALTLFHNNFYRQMLQVGIGLKTSAAAAQAFIAKASMFPIVIEGEAVDECDILFANHQGPTVDEGSASKSPYGGFETLLIPAVLPPKTRTVLKASLTQISPEVKGLIRRCIKGISTRAIRLANPILLHRPEGEDAKQVAFALREERLRVAQEVYTNVQAGTPVLVYPEGTRSPTGKIANLAPEFFAYGITDYIQSRLQGGKSINIGLIVADTLQAMPQGFLRNAPLYRRPITIHTEKFNSTEIEAAVTLALGQKGEDLVSSDEDVKRLARVFGGDVQTRMQEILRSILEKSLEKNI